MPVNMKKMRKSYDDQQSGGEFIAFDVGETLLYVHPPCRGEADKWEPTAGLPYIPVTIHYSVGKKNAMVVSLDRERNPIIEHPFVKKALKKRKIDLEDVECPVAAELESGGMSDEEADEARPQTRYLWGVTPLKRRGSSREEWSAMSAKPSIAMVGKQIYDGFMEAFFDNGDITDPDAAILVRVVREGKSRNDTKYKVKIEPSTIKKPFKLPAKIRAAVAKATAEDGDCDLFRLVASLIKPPSDVEALLSGVATSAPDDDEEEEKPRRSKRKAPPPEEEEDDEEEEEEDEPEEEEEEDDGLEEEEEDDEEEEEPEEEEEDDGLEEEEEEDEEEEEEPPPKKKTSKKASKKAEDDDEEDDLGLSELEAALEEIEEEEAKSSKKAPAKKASKKTSKKTARK